jgi:uncharacterized protein (TIGR02246 family)
MRATGIALAFLVCVSSAAGARQLPLKSDEAAVRDVVAKYTNARGAKDPKAIEALFTADADQHTTAGEWRRGRAAIVPGALRSSAQNPGDRRITVESVRFLTPDVAIADGPYVLLDAKGAVTRRMWTTIVVVREGDGWHIGAIRNMLPAGN